MRTKSLLVLLALAPLAAAAPNCPYSGPFNREAVIHRLSVSAEAVAPTVGRRRAVGQPGTLPVANFIDSYISAKLQKSGVSPTAIAGDEEFLRRVTLDLTGEIPDPSAVQAFVNNPSPGKRAQKIDELLASDAFTDRWTMWFGDLVQNVKFSSNYILYYTGRNTYHSWIRDSIRGGMPYDQMVREVVAGGNDTTTGAAANFYARQYVGAPLQDGNDNLASFAGEKFLGLPLLCISCHDGRGHLEAVNTYLKGKSRRDFWRTAAFFSRSQMRFTAFLDPLDPSVYLSTYFVSDTETGRYDLNTIDGNKTPRAPASGEPAYVLPAFILSGEEPRSNEPYRTAFGRLLTAHRQFARATVNDLWKEMFGLGIVEPAHGFDLAKLDTQASHPELLEALADEFIAGGYNLRSLLRTIALSNTYQLSSKYTAGPWNEAWVPLYARHYPRRLMGEMIFDAVVKATGVVSIIDVRGAPAVTRAMQLPDPLEPEPSAPVSRFLNNFGRGNRDDVPRTGESSILQVLAVMNDTVVTNRVRRSISTSTVSRLLATTTDPAAIADQIYLATLSRKPTAAEREIAVDDLRQGPLGDRAEDLQYALLNSLEFLFN